MPRMKTRHLTLLALTFAALSPVSAAVRLPSIFSDHAVLQREAKVPVWGWADPNEEITVTVAGQSQTAKAAADGKWRVDFQNLKASGPQELVVKGANTITLQDV